MAATIRVLFNAAIENAVISAGRAHHGAGGVKSAQAEAGADQGLHHVAQNIVAVGAAIIARLLAKADVRAEAVDAGDPGAGGAADQRVQALRQAALVAIVAFEYPFGDDEAQHPVAQELQPLVILRLRTAGGHAAMGQRARPFRLIPHRGADHRAQQGTRRLGQGGCGCGPFKAQNVPPIRLQRAADTQVHGRNQFAEPSVDHIISVARPTRLA